MADSSDHWEGDLEGTLSDGCGERSKTVGSNARNIIFQSYDKNRFLSQPMFPSRIACKGFVDACLAMSSKSSILDARRTQR